MTVIDIPGTRTGAEVAVCAVAALEPNLGECVLLPDGQQVALFKVLDPRMDLERVYAVSNVDPYMNAAVMSRGIVGEHEGAPTVASPLLKQVFRLEDGRALDDDGRGLEVFRAEIRDGEVIIAY